MHSRLDTKRPYLLLDAGGTLVCPDVILLARAASHLACQVESDAFVLSFFRMIHRFDRTLKETGRWDRNVDFLLDVVAAAGVPGNVAAQVLAHAYALNSSRSLWTCALPGAREAVATLHASGYRMSVVSNSDGSAARQMADLSLSSFFDTVFDSHVLGVAKPDPRIFEIVLSDLGLTPNDCLFVGDVFMVDVLGANAAGIPGIHLDPLGLCAGWPGMRARDLNAFAELLGSGRLDLRDRRLLAFPSAATYGIEPPQLKRRKPGEAWREARSNG
jgi:putative hydrolase of the HAD superfamily